MYVCVYTYIHIIIYICRCVCIYIYIYLIVYIQMYKLYFVYIYIYTVRDIYIKTFIRVCTYIYIYNYVESMDVNGVFKATNILGGPLLNFFIQGMYHDCNPLWNVFCHVFFAKQHIPSIRFPSRSSGFLMNMSIIIDKSQTEDYPFLLTIIAHY